MEDSFSRALYTFDIGQNDLTAGYKLNMTTEEVKAYVPDVLGQFSNAIKVIQIHNNHFKKILVHTMMIMLHAENIW